MPGEDVTDATAEAATPRTTGEFLVRLVSGVLLAAVTIAAAWLGPWPFAGLVLLVALLMSWEWGRVVRKADFDLSFVVHAIAIVIAVGLAAFGYAALGLAVLAIATIIAVPLQFGSYGLLSAAGVLYTGVPAVALLWLRGDEPHGFWAVLFIFAVVWATDTVAYATGRLLGGPKLWPAVSPKKTWSGLLGGIGAGALAGAAFATYYAGASPTALAVSGLILGLVAQGGDLAESALKRHFGVKDASNLIPGHGGFMDRMDGVVTVAATAALFALFANAGAPAQALLLGH